MVFGKGTRFSYVVSKSRTKPFTCLGDVMFLARSSTPAASVSRSNRTVALEAVVPSKPNKNGEGMRRW